MFSPNCRDIKLKWHLAFIACRAEGGHSHHRGGGRGGVATRDQLREPITHELDFGNTEQKVGAVIITALDEVAWLLNLRGGDVDYNPVFISYAIVTPDAATLYVDSAKVRRRKSPK